MTRTRLRKRKKWVNTGQTITDNIQDTNFDNWDSLQTQIPNILDLTERKLNYFLDPVTPDQEQKIQWAYILIPEDKA